MGMFGRRKSPTYEAAGLERPGLGAQVLNQIGMNLLGVDLEGQRVREAMARQVAEANRQAADLLQPVPGQIHQARIGNADGEDITAGFAPQYDQGPPTRRSPAEIAAGLARLSNTPGFNPTTYRELASFAKPDLMALNNVLVDKSDPANANREIPQVAEGQQHVFDAQGRPIGVMDVNGYVQSLANRKEAEALGQTLGGLQTVGDGNGGQVQVTGREFLGAPGRGVGGLGWTPPAARLSADKIVADAQATAQTTLPSDLSTVDSAIQTASELRNHPALKDRTGWKSVFPALPGTPGASFEAYKEQVLGQGFLNGRQALKGGGPITDLEGLKAEQAIIRAKAAQTPEDFQKAVDDYIGALQRGRAVMQQRAGGAPRAAPGARQPPAVGTVVRGYRYLGGDPASPNSWRRN